MADSAQDITVETPYGTINFPHDTPRDVVSSKTQEFVKKQEPGSEKVARVMKEAPFFPGAALYGSMTPATRGEFNLAQTDVLEFLRQNLHRVPWIGGLFPDQGGLESEREKNRQLAASGEPVERGVGRVAGTVFNPVYGGIGEGAEALTGTTQAGRFLGGTAAGTAGGAIQPGPQGETGQEELQRHKREAGESGVGSAVISALTMGHGKELSDLLEQNIRPTLADVIPTGIGQQVEHLAARVPILRSLIKGGAGRQVEDYNRALYRYATEPTVGRVKPPSDVGTPALNKLKTDIGNEINDSIRKLSITGSGAAPLLSQFRASVFRNVPGGATFSQANRAYIAKAINDAVERPIVLSGGRVTGDTLLTMFSELSKRATNKWRTAVSEDDRNTARALGMLQDMIRNNLQGPKAEIQRLAQSRSAYARYKEVAEAAGNNPAGGELATPDTYRRSMKRRLGGADQYAELDDPRKTVTESASALGVGKRLPPVSALETGVGLHLLGLPAAAAFGVPTGLAYSAPGMWALQHQPQLMSPLAALAIQAQGGDRQ